MKTSFNAPNFFDEFVGLDRIKAKLRKIEKLLGIKEDLEIYSSNANALAGGLKVGDTYRTSTGSLMIVYPA